MDHRFKRWRSLAGALLLLTLLVVVVGSVQADPYPQSTLHPKGDFAQMVDKLFQTTLFWATLVFVLTEAALVFVIFKFRGKPGGSGAEAGARQHDGRGHLDRDPGAGAGDDRGADRPDDLPHLRDSEGR